MTVSRSPSGILMIGNIVSEDGRYTTQQLGDIMANRVEDRIKRIDGVGSIQAFGSGYAMRIWLDPSALEQYQLTPADVITAVKAQNVQVSVGKIGDSPAVKGQQLLATVTAQSLLTTVDQFKAITLKITSDGSTVRVGDVARVELGMESYGSSTTYNGKPAAGFGVQLASGANAISTANAVHAELDSLASTLPEGVSVAYSYETTPFVEQSIQKVIETLIEAIVLVFVVLLFFLQNLRATLIPMIAIPVVLLGTFGILAAFGYSINMLTMFAMVLAIGLLVDDAIVVVENVERIMTEEGLSPREATEKSMSQITGALIGVALVLTAVFIPMAFFGGSVGVIYRQFSVTIASAMILSVLVAIILTPALCAIILKPVVAEQHHRILAAGIGWFNRGVGRVTRGYVGSSSYLITRPLRMLVVFAAICVGAYMVYTNLPSSFVPEEDQGVLITQVSLPTGANAARTQAVVDLVEKYFLTQEKDAVASVFATVGFSYGASGENAAMAFVRLKDYGERKSKSLSASAVAGRASAYFSQIRDAQIFALAPPAIQGLGQSSGFTMYLEDTGGKGRDALTASVDQLTKEANQSGAITGARTSSSTPESQLKIVIDQQKAGALGVDLSAANAVLATAFGGSKVNDFISEGEIKPVYVQGDAPYRMQPRDLDKWYARNASGEMVPFAAFAKTEWTKGPQQLARFNGTAAIEVQGAAASGTSSGVAMNKMEQLVSGLDGGYTELVDRSFLSGAPVRLTGHPALCDLGAGRLPQPCRALRELVDPAVRHSCRAYRHAGRAALGAFLRPVQRRLFQGRPAHHHRPGLQERHPDRGVCPRPGGTGQDHPGGDPGGGAHPYPADRHDLAGLHAGRSAAGAGNRRRLGRATCHRLRGARRHVGLDGGRSLLRAGILRPDPARLATEARAT